MNDKKKDTASSIEDLMMNFGGMKDEPAEDILPQIDAEGNDSLLSPFADNDMSANTVSFKAIRKNASDTDREPIELPDIRSAVSLDPIALGNDDIGKPSTPEVSESWLDDAVITNIPEPVPIDGDIADAEPDAEPAPDKRAEHDQKAMRILQKKQKIREKKERRAAKKAARTAENGELSQDDTADVPTDTGEDVTAPAFDDNSVEESDKTSHTELPIAAETPSAPDVDGASDTEAASSANEKSAKRKKEKREKAKKDKPDPSAEPKKEKSEKVKKSKSQAVEKPEESKTEAAEKSAKIKKPKVRATEKPSAVKKEKKGKKVEKQKSSTNAQPKSGDTPSNVSSVRSVVTAAAVCVAAVVLISVANRFTGGNAHDNTAVSDTTAIPVTTVASDTLTDDASVPTPPETEAPEPDATLLSPKVDKVNHPPENIAVDPAPRDDRIHADYEEDTTEYETLTTEPETTLDTADTES